MLNTPTADFLRWYMPRVTCGPLFLAVCRNCAVCSNLLEHLQVPPLRLRGLTRFPSCRRLRSLKTSADWNGDQNLCCKALRQPHDIAPPRESPLLIDAGAVSSISS